MVAIKNAKPSSSKSRNPWPLDTFWSSSSKKASSTSKPCSPASPKLARSYDSTSGLDSDQIFDFSDLPLTPPDSGTSTFELHAASKTARSARAQDDPLLVSTAASPPVLLHDDQLNPTSKGGSKNDIFNSPTTWLTPPSHIPPVPDTAISSPPPSKNSLFFSSFGSSSPIPPSPPSRRLTSAQSMDSASAKTSSALSDSAEPSTAVLATSASQHTTGRKKGHARNSSLGRASSEECLQEEARIRLTKHVDFRLCPSNEYLLGEGRHCSVYLGSYRPRPEFGSDPSSSQCWRLCAVKRLHADRQSQLLGLDEAFALRRLGVHPNIIRLIDIRDEVEFAASPRPSSQISLQGGDRSAGLDLGLGLPRVELRSGATSHSGHSSHSRSTSDMTGKDELLLEAQSHKRALAHRKQHEAALSRAISPTTSQTRIGVMTSHETKTRSSILPNPSFVLQGPDEGSSDSGRNAKSSADKTPDTNPVRRATPVSNPIVDPPRLLILLELLPNNLALYTRRHPRRVTLNQWHTWALEMCSALVFLHSHGCVHADIKKENMLLTEDLNIKVCDFNSAVFPNPNDLPRDGLGLGTPAYCAPELSRATGGPAATSFSYPIDVFSLGAVLYSLATGYEPFSKARSVVEMLHRKRLFFESEENDRASRLAVEAGSNPSSAPASRSGSMRGRHHKTPSTDTNTSAAQITSSLNRLLSTYSSPPSSSTRREASTDSLESVASSITTISGRNPTSLAVSRLLEPADEPRGLLVDPSTPSRSASFLRELGKADVRRTASTGGRKGPPGSTAGLARLRAGEELEQPQSPSLRSAPLDNLEADALELGGKNGSAVHPVASLEISSRPDWLRRTSSYGDEMKLHHQNLAPGLSPAAPIPEHSGVENLSSIPVKPSRLRAMVSPSSKSFTQFVTPSPPAESGDGASSRDFNTFSEKHNSHLRAGGQENEMEAEREDIRAYADGHPAIILPGGGRLPDWARDLLRIMVEPDPNARPTAIQVLERLQMHAPQI
nr:serine threonine protein kinase [Melanopsichium pennsylvanicum 4]